MENMSYRQRNCGLSAWTVSCQGVGEVLLGISGKTLSNALSTSLRDSSKLSSWQQAKRAEEWPPEIARGNPHRKGTKPILPVPTGSAKEICYWLWRNSFSSCL